MKWIDIKEKKPAHGEWVLTYHKHNGMEVSNSLNHSFQWVTHWMPLPKRP
jgi:hypothetical protein